MGMLSLRDQLRLALQEKGWTIARLLDESGLTCDRSSIDRKINGRQPMCTEECEALARALGARLAWTGTHARKRHGKRRSKR